MDKITITASNIKKSYGKKTILKNINIAIHSNEIVGLLGPNGAGKTTTFYILIGIVFCDYGKILLNEEDITNYSIHRRANLGISYLPQDTSVFRKLSTQDNIMAILEQNHQLNWKQKQDRLEELLESFSLTHIRKDLGNYLSGGEKRRLEIARILAINPKIVFLDEPFAGVDPKSIIELKKIITHLKDLGIGVLITDHNVRETLDICQKAYIVNEGEIIASGNTEEILNNEQVRKHYLGNNFKI